MLLVACTILAGSCTKESPKDTDIPSGTLQFEISATNSLQTKGNLYSQEPVHSVADVKVYVFKKSGSDYLYLKTYQLPWTAGSSSGRYYVPASEMIPTGDYKFLAVGRNATDSFTLPTLTANTTSYDAFIVSVASAGLETDIFSGSHSMSVVSEGMRVPITITRKVAGILGYFKNVPANIGGRDVKYLRLNISNSDRSLNLTTGLGSNPTGVGYNLINVDLRTQTINSEGAFSGNDLTAQGVVKLPNSQLYGSFVIPVTGIQLTLGLYDAQGTALKTWTIQNDTADSTFDITANHFYALGTKVATGTTTGTADNPVADAPIDLMKDQVISVTISPDWSVIHDMTIQP